MEYDNFYKFLEGRPVKELNDCIHHIVDMVGTRFTKFQPKLESIQKAAIEAMTRIRSGYDDNLESENIHSAAVMRNIICLGIQTPFGMNGFNTKTKRFIQWLPGYTKPASAKVALEQNLKTEWFFHKELQIWLNWNPEGYYEMSRKDSLKFNESRPTNKHLLDQDSSRHGEKRKLDKASHHDDAKKAKSEAPRFRFLSSSSEGEQQKEDQKGDQNATGQPDAGAVDESQDMFSPDDIRPSLPAAGTSQKASTSLEHVALSNCSNVISKEEQKAIELVRRNGVDSASNTATPISPPLAPVKLQPLKGDTVYIISGSYAGKKGTVLGQRGMDTDVFKIDIDQPGGEHMIVTAATSEISHKNPDSNNKGAGAFGVGTVEQASPGAKVLKRRRGVEQPNPPQIEDIDLLSPPPPPPTQAATSSVATCASPGVSGNVKEVKRKGEMEVDEESLDEFFDKLQSESSPSPSPDPDPDPDSDLRNPQQKPRGDQPEEDEPYFKRHSKNSVAPKAFAAATSSAASSASADAMATRSRTAGKKATQPMEVVEEVQQSSSSSSSTEKEVDGQDNGHGTAEKGGDETQQGEPEPDNDVEGVEEETPVPVPNELREAYEGAISSTFVAGQAAASSLCNPCTLFSTAASSPALPQDSTRTVDEEESPKEQEDLDEQHAPGEHGQQRKGIPQVSQETESSQQSQSQSQPQAHSTQSQCMDDQALPAAAAADQAQSLSPQLFAGPDPDTPTKKYSKEVEQDKKEAVTNAEAKNERMEDEPVEPPAMGTSPAVATTTDAQANRSATMGSMNIPSATAAPSPDKAATEAATAAAAAAKAERKKKRKQQKAAAAQSAVSPPDSAVDATLPAGTKVRILMGEFKGQLAEVLEEAKAKGKGGGAVAGTPALKGVYKLRVLNDRSSTVVMPDEFLQQVPGEENPKTNPPAVGGNSSSQQYSPTSTSGKPSDGAQATDGKSTQQASLTE